MTDKVSTQISTNGLRYVNKPSGSPFGTSGTERATMSCFKCGLHKPRALGMYKRYLNQSMFVCGECSAPKVSKVKIAK